MTIYLSRLSEVDTSDKKLTIHSFLPQCYSRIRRRLTQEAFSTFEMNTYVPRAIPSQLPYVNIWRFSINVREGIVGNYLVDPYLLPENLTGIWYCVFLEKVLPGLLQFGPLTTQTDMWITRDGAPTHFTTTVCPF